MGKLTHKGSMEKMNFGVQMSNNYKNIIILCSSRTRSQEKQISNYGQVVTELKKINGAKTEPVGYGDVHIYYPMPQTEETLKTFLSQVGNATADHEVLVDSQIPLN